MDFGLSTRWNASRHIHGDAMIREILDLNIRHVELGYDLMIPLVDGVQKLVADGSVIVNSVHNFCPVPGGAMAGHPELFELASSDERNRKAAVAYTLRTVEFAAEMKASVVVAHAGYVDIRIRTPDLISLCENGKQYSPKYEKIRMQLLLDREQAAPAALERLQQSIADLLPALKALHVRLALENLPFWEAVPCEAEMPDLWNQFGTDHLGYWHDTGHSQLRQKLGFIGSRMWAEKLDFGLAGFHIHDLTGVAHDHIMPPKGEIDFSWMSKLFRPGRPVVLEPSPGTPADDIRRAMEVLKEQWK